MLPLQWVGFGLVLVVLDLRLGGWDVLPDPLGWVMALCGVLPLRATLGRDVVVLAGGSLVVAAVELVPGLLQVSAPLGWALSLPQLGFVGLTAWRLAERLPARRQSMRAVAWTAVVVAVAPAFVLATPVPALVGLLAFVAVAVLLWFVFLLLACAPDLASPQAGAASGDPGRSPRA